MRKKSSWLDAVAMVALGLATAGFSSGCATKKYVRTQVDESARNISATLSSRIDETDRRVQGNTGQIEELGSVTRQHSGQIASLDGGLKQTDQRAQQALSVGEGAQSTADKATRQVSALDENFLNRNNYAVFSEQFVQFKFSSAKVEESYRAVLDEVAQQAQQSPDTILVLEGHTDSVGDATYNIQLGEKRLDAVLRYLVVEQGLPLHKVFKMSFGEARPLTSNDTREGRAKNRSVIVRVMGPNFAKTGESVVSEATPQR